MYEGYEISLTELGDYIWCPNKPVIALMKANEKIRINNAIVEQTYSEDYPSVVIVKKSVYTTFQYYEKPFYIDNYLYQIIVKELKCEYKGDYFTLYEEEFSIVMDILREGMDSREWSKLTYLMGSVAEGRFAKYDKGTEKYLKKKIMTNYNGFIIINIPDAILNNNMVYEFKTVQYTEYVDKQFRIAELQADLTAYLFGYDYIYVEVMDFNDLKIHSVKRKANLNRAEEVLNEIFDNYEGAYINKKHIDNRCKNCIHKNDCNK